MVDPTLLNEQKSKKRKQEGELSVFFRTFIFSLLGALVGAFVCVVVDYFVGNITGLIYFFIGMTSCAFYVYFIEKKDQKKLNVLIIMLACLLAATLAVFVSSAILYAPGVNDTELNIFEKTVELYRQNIQENGFNSYKHEYAGGAGELYYNLSLLSFHVICTVMSFIGLAASLLFVNLTSSSWEKKHKNEKPNYGYSSRTKKSKGTKKRK